MFGFLYIQYLSSSNKAIHKVLQKLKDLISILSILEQLYKNNLFAICSRIYTGYETNIDI